MLRVFLFCYPSHWKNTDAKPKKRYDSDKRNMKTFQISNLHYVLCLLFGLGVASCELDTTDPNSPHAGKLEKVVFAYNVNEKPQQKDSVGFTYNTSGKTLIYNYTNPTKTYNVVQLAESEAIGGSYVLSTVASGYTAYAESMGQSVRQTVIDSTVGSSATVKHSLEGRSKSGTYYDNYSMTAVTYGYANEIRTDVSEKQTTSSPPETSSIVYTFDFVTGNYNAERIKIANAFLLSTLYAYGGYSDLLLPDLGTIPLKNSLVPTFNTSQLIPIPRSGMPLYAMDPSKIPNTYIPDKPISSITLTTSGGAEQGFAVTYVAGPELVYGIDIDFPISIGINNERLSFSFYWY